MIKHLFLLLLLVSIRCSAQDDYTQHYPDGRLKAVYRHTSRDTSELRRFYPGGQLRDSSWYRNVGGKLVVFGIARRYYQDGKLKEHYVNDPAPNQNIPFLEKRTYYPNGLLQYNIVKRGIDTLEYKRYYKNGKIRDSVWLYMGGKHELVLGTGRSYYDNGQVKEITQQGKTSREYNLARYRKNGDLERIVRRPTGVTQFYGKNNQVKRQVDRHKDKDLYLPRTYRDGNHLRSTPYAVRISSKKAWLVNPRGKRKIKAGKLMDIRLKSDTTLLRHCLVEGFSRDSIFFTKLDYNPAFKTKRGEPIMKHDSTFVIACDQLSVIHYSLHDTPARRFWALNIGTLGVMLFILPPVELLVFMASDPHLNYSHAAQVTGIMMATGAPLIYWGRYLNRTAIPKMYLMDKWKVVVKN